MNKLASSPPSVQQSKQTPARRASGRERGRRGGLQRGPTEARRLSEALGGPGSCLRPFPLRHAHQRGRSSLASVEWGSALNPVAGAACRGGERGGGRTGAAFRPSVRALECHLSGVRGPTGTDRRSPSSRSDRSATKDRRSWLVAPSARVRAGEARRPTRGREGPPAPRTSRPGGAGRGPYAALRPRVRGVGCT